MAVDKEHIKRRLAYNPETGEIYNKFISESEIYTKKFVEWFNKNRAGKVHKRKDSYGYIQIWFAKKGKNSVVLGHRIAWLLYYGDWPTKTIDHINGVRDDNRIENLQEVSHKENQQNKVYEYILGNCGVFYNDRADKYIAFVCKQSGKTKYRKHLNAFDTEKAAWDHLKQTGHLVEGA